MLLAMLALATIQASTPSPAAKPPACSKPEHEQFDFWLGRWDVYQTGKEKLVARSHIEKLYGGCTVRENWMPLQGSGGGSLNMYDPSDQRWHQTWHDSSNGRVVFEGGRVGARMVLLGWWRDLIGPGQHALVRMTYSTGADGSVRQFGEQSVDHGLSWSPSFDFTYRPAR